MAHNALQGEITKVSGIKTYKVTIHYKKVHPLYRKIVAYKKSFLAHSENEHAVGEVVSIVPAPHRISHSKHYLIVEESKVTKK